MSHESKSPLLIWFAIIALIVFFPAMNWYFNYMDYKREEWRIEASKTPAEYAYNMVSGMKSNVELPKMTDDGLSSWTDLRAVNNKIQFFHTMGTEEEYELLKSVWPNSESYKRDNIKKGSLCMLWDSGVFDSSRGVVMEFFITYGNIVRYNFIVTPKDCGK